MMESDSFGGLPVHLIPDVDCPFVNMMGNDFFAAILKHFDEEPILSKSWSRQVSSKTNCSPSSTIRS